MNSSQAILHRLRPLSPVNYTFEVQAMTSKLISPHDKLSNHVNELVQGNIEGETHVLAASMTMEEVFRGTEEFKQEVFKKVQHKLNQFELLIYNVNVKQLVERMNAFTA
ncbi:SPFH/band 7/PHB domain membrane-associated family protein [Medicago truncatula]|uniref:Flotillin-like n=2 Tax=Medicago truncatula TaxID=3880 RepID=G7J9E0_MEDTR|nr:SPFH/band 7/PHB domain membrane-associated family protein [Medicago truncatula]